MSDVASVKNMLMNYQLDDIRDVSAGAATFYVWVIGEKLQFCDIAHLHSYLEYLVWRQKWHSIRN